MDAACGFLLGSLGEDAICGMGDTGGHGPSLLTRASLRRLRRDVPNRCNTHFDAVAQIRGEAFFFKGKHLPPVAFASG